MLIHQSQMTVLIDFSVQPLLYMPSNIIGYRYWFFGGAALMESAVQHEVQRNIVGGARPLAATILLSSSLH